MRSAIAIFASLLFANMCPCQGLKPVTDEEFKNLPRYNPKTAVEIVTKTVNGVEVAETKIVEGPLPDRPPSVDLSKYAPKPGQQSFQDCTAWATAYCCLSTQNAKHRGIEKPNDPIDLFSPRFVYSQINGGRDSGSCIYSATTGPNDSAVSLFQAKGCSSNLITPYIAISQSATGWSAAPNSAGIGEAKNYRLFQHTKCETVDDIQYALVFGIPVVIGAYTEPAFENHRGASIYAWNGGTNGRHAMCIRSYDIAMQAFRVQNSWGESWGDQGRFWVGFKEFAKLNTNQRSSGWCYEAHAIILNHSSGTQIRSTSAPTASYYFTPDGGVQKKGDGTRIAAAGKFRAVESTNTHLYGLTTDGIVQAFHDDHWDDISANDFPAGLGGGKTKSIAASGKFLYILTERNNICGRVPGEQSSNGTPFWEKINLPDGKSPADLRFRDNGIFVEANDGTLFKRLVGTGWQTVP